MNRLGTRTLIAFSLGFILALSPALTAGVASAQQTLKERVVGMWRLLSWESVRSNGDVVNLWMGAHPTGTIMYLPNGYMAVQSG